MLPWTFSALAKADLCSATLPFRGDLKEAQEGRQKVEVEAA